MPLIISTYSGCKRSFSSSNITLYYDQSIIAGIFLIDFHCLKIENPHNCGDFPLIILLTNLSTTVKISAGRSSTTVTTSVTTSITAIAVIMPATIITRTSRTTIMMYWLNISFRFFKQSYLRPYSCFENVSFQFDPHHPVGCQMHQEETNQLFWNCGFGRT